MTDQQTKNTNPRILTTICDRNIVLVTLNRAEKFNAIDYAMFKEIISTIKTLKKNRHIRAVIVTGNGDNFSSGIDIKSLLGNAKHAAELLFKWLPGSANKAQQVSTGWRTIPAPVIFAIHGRCWGAGLQIALGGDFRIATPDSNWSIMEGKWGLIPDMGGSIAFKNQLRADYCLELAMTAKQITGIEAHQNGLVTHISEQPLTAAYELANQIIERSPDAVAACKKLIYRTATASNRGALLRETYYQIKVLLGKNQRIAVKRANQESSEKTAFKARSFD